MRGLRASLLIRRRPLLPRSTPLTSSHAYVSIPKPPPPPSSSSPTQAQESQPTNQQINSPATAAAATVASPDLKLPAPGQGQPNVTLDVSSSGGSGAKLSHLGPLVVNEDGSLARITNWAGMTEAERETTVRVVGKRNRERLEAVKRRREAEVDRERGEGGE